jgi:hypothetical protein
MLFSIMFLICGLEKKFSLIFASLTLRNLFFTYKIHEWPYFWFLRSFSLSPFQSASEPNEIFPCL